ncbi:LruC domain-containing protein [Bacteroides sp. 224]|uniref:LruC domain-containing protein n=1 Tax=Bacteroides sp. 224 TaxID=2302936 RepID=UPI0013D7ADE4|nr:LruC domain-containing protein [Bacteroides sp. 224]NDV64801.1 LruC domain-containing protein [Bacteroides sp. 224]
MKKILFIFSVVFLGVFSSCESDKSLPKSNQEENLGDLIVPNDFDWKTTRTVTCNIQSSVPTVIYIYNAVTCDEKGLVAIYHPIANKDNAFSLKLATHLNEVYLKYSDVVVPVKIENGMLNYTIPETGTRATRTIEPCNGCNENDIIYFPCLGDWATVLYEDLFPNEGDYDFNDVVLNYKRTYFLDIESKRLQRIVLEMRVNALGGTLNYYPCFRIDGVAREKVWRIGLQPQGNFTFKLGDDPDKDKDSTFRILEVNDKPVGCQFLNTLPNEKKRPKSELKHFLIVIDFLPNNMPTLGELSSLDVFIYNDDMEIHERGGVPAWTECPILGKDYYCSIRNLVWGITVPLEIKHATERTNFLKAYPKFKRWVITGGVENQNWYYDGKEEHLFTIPEN